MRPLAFQPAPFFDDKTGAFWRLQFAGWAGAMVLRTMSALAGQQEWDFLIPILIQTITGFSISLVLSVIYRQLIDRRPLVTWTATVVVLFVAVALYAFIDGWVNALYRPDSETPIVQRLLSFFYIDLTLLGAWSALYYAINYFLRIEEQADRLERLEMQATTAQLAMLRYQLNPHFLFNTLNSISTLVLLKQTEPANAMLTRLSAFLRHTLVSQPGSKVTVAQEVDTLKLYLEIERMRFEERLRTRFQIDPAAQAAELPSMLLQPLVENAIKYAVGPQEEGAEISICAQLVGPRLRVTVSDTGPGLPDGQRAASVLARMTGEGNNAAVTGPVAASSAARPTSTGVGLANIRDRLAQAYGEDHLFEIRTPAEGGFTVVIELPHETAATPANEVAATAPDDTSLTLSASARAATGTLP
ncbi:MAG: sensor histidine kinase [Pelagerythrobacter marensis]|nr:MAG: sensor histidine kinase [Pelagerythrobacter marensis]